MEEILDAVIYEIENSGYFEKLSAGIVLTGGGALLKHLPALVKFKTGMDVRIGYPTEHLASDAKSTTKVNESEIEVEDNIEEEQEVIKKEGKSGLIGTFKKVFTDIFDEEDAEM